MASNINQMVNFENPMTMNVKNLARSDRTPQRKMAFGDIKNAPSAIEKSSMKMIDVKTTTKTKDESIEKESASSKYVDYFSVWTDDLALSDAEVNRWVTMLNVARTMNLDNEEKTPPPSSPSFIEEEIPFLDDTFEPLEAPPLPEFPTELGSPASDSSLYYSFNDSSFESEL